jgi:hypothetical protein
MQNQKYEDALEAVYSIQEKVHLTTGAGKEG